MLRFSGGPPLANFFYPFTTFYIAPCIYIIIGVMNEGMLTALHAIVYYEDVILIPEDR